MDNVPPSKAIDTLFLTDNLVGAGSVGKWGHAYSNEPDSGDSFVTVYDTEGVIDGVLQKTMEMVEHFGILVRVRGTDHDTVRAKARSLFKALRAVHMRSVVVGTITVSLQAFNPTTQPTRIGQDERRRELFTFNGLLTAREV